MKIDDNIRHFQSLLPEGVELVAVSKFHPAEAIRLAYDAGQRKFGESRVAELLGKIEQLPGDIEWHFIGHLQTNKVKQIVGKVSLIESVDSQRLLDLIDRISEEKGVTTNVLMQVHVAREETKFGWSPEELIEYFSEKRYRSLKSTRLCGIMGMATNTGDREKVAGDFLRLRTIYDSIREMPETDKSVFNLLSMGMSGDWPLAVEEGANIVRVGSAIFGDRIY